MLIMLPEYRNNDTTFSIPKFTIEKKEVEDFIDELRVFHEQFNDCFSRSEPRENFFRYAVGRFSNLEKKSIEPIALNIQGGEVRSMQRFISDIVWDENKILHKYHNLVNEDMGNTKGVLIFDESGFVKKGDNSAAVGKQYCGNLGKVENCCPRVIIFPIVVKSNPHPKKCKLYFIKLVKKLNYRK